MKTLDAAVRSFIKCERKNIPVNNIKTLNSLSSFSPKGQGIPFTANSKIRKKELWIELPNKWILRLPY